MGDEWLTSEPEVGTVAKVKDYNGDVWMAICCLADDGGKIWDSDNFILECDKEWQPITTPEERRLRAEVERLRELIARHMDHFDRTGKSGAFIDRELWLDSGVLNGKKTEAGGAG